MAAGQRTEEATPRKIRRARERGEVATSRDLTMALTWWATLAVFFLAGSWMGARLIAMLTDGLSTSASLGRDALLPTMIASAEVGFVVLAPLLGALLFVGTIVSFLQVGPLLSLEAIAPRLDRLNPSRGVQNLFSQRKFVELGKNLVKLLLVAVVLAFLLAESVRGMVSLVGRSPETLLRLGTDPVLALGVRVGGLLLFLAVIDVAYQRWRFRRDQRMTKEEVQREHRETEGDPRAKQARERIYREMVTQAALHDVRRADVLVVNPTHYAVALRYDDREDEDRAPEVLAKGEEELARRMIEAAREAGVPILRDVPLAHALYALEEGTEIPPHLYEAVAAILRAAWAEREADGSL
ncbi:MAG: EscU/YscU/HrcU family type III secretion system export apparatus switch protein [Myxococcales bacterium]|nr:EscU/YscU/HrcU family type III secretion system export apparatus switch protein [Myxococcales bacterium]